MIKKTEETKQKVINYIKSLLGHDFASLLSKTLDKSDPLFDTFKGKTKNIAIIKMKLTTNKYNNTNDVIKELDELFL